MICWIEFGLQKNPKYLYALLLQHFGIVKSNAQSLNNVNNNCVDFSPFEVQVPLAAYASKMEYKFKLICLRYDD